MSEIPCEGPAAEMHGPGEVYNMIDELLEGIVVLFTAVCAVFGYARHRPFLMLFGLAFFTFWSNLERISSFARRILGQGH